MNNQDRFELKSGGGCVAIFGLPFLLAGIAVIVAVFIPQEVRGGDPFPWYVGIPFGSVFALIGGAFVFGRSSFVIDKISSTVTSSWSLFITLKTKTLDLKKFNRILITKEVRRGNNSSTTVYPVYLEGKGTKELVQESQLYNNSRQLSEDLSKFLDFDVCDTSSESEVIRQAGTMDMSVRDKLINSNEYIELPDEPANMKSECYMLDDTFVVEIPSSTFNPLSLIGLVPFLFFIPFMIFIGDMINVGKEVNNAPLPVQLIGSVFALIFLIVPLGMIYKIAIKPIITKKKLELNKYELRYTTSALLTKKIILQCSEIEEVFIKGRSKDKSQEVPEIVKLIINTLLKNNGITIRTDKTTLNIGEDLDKEELNYILAVINQTLIS